MPFIKPPDGEPLVLTNPVVVERSPQEDEHLKDA
jgi:hypothetical protein